MRMWRRVINEAKILQHKTQNEFAFWMKDSTQPEYIMSMKVTRGIQRDTGIMQAIKMLCIKCYKKSLLCTSCQSKCVHGMLHVVYKLSIEVWTWNVACCEQAVNQSVYMELCTLCTSYKPKCVHLMLHHCVQLSIKVCTRNLSGIRCVKTVNQSTCMYTGFCKCCE